MTTLHPDLSLARAVPRSPRFTTSPTARVVTLLALVVAIAVAPPTRASLIVSVGLAALVVAAVRPAFRRVVGPLVIGAMTATAMLIPMFLTGATHDAAMRSARALLCLVIAVSVGSSLSRAELTSAFATLRLPRALVETLRTMLDTLESLRTRGTALVLARRLRRATSAYALLTVLPSLFLVSIRRAEKLELAMRLRRYSPESVLTAEGLRLGDLPLLLGVALGLAGLFLVSV